MDANVLHAHLAAIFPADLNQDANMAHAPEPQQNPVDHLLHVFDGHYQQLTQLEANRAQRETHLAERTRIRELEKRLITQTSSCDGSSMTSVRQWIDEIEMIRPEAVGARARAQSLMAVVTQTISGSLRREVERFIVDYAGQHAIDRLAVPWVDLRAHVRRAFLTPNEAAHLRDVVDKMKQNGYEMIAGYNRCFRDAADAGYPVADRNEDQSRILLTAYTRGLTDDAIARELVTREHPATVELAMTAAARQEQGTDEYMRLRRGERGMEVSALAVSDTTKPDVLGLLEKMTTQQERLSTKMGKLETRLNQSTPPFRQMNQSTPPFRQMNQPRPPFRQTYTSRPPFRQTPRVSTGPPGRTAQRPPNPRYTNEGKTICFKCGRPGHIQRDCRDRQSVRRPTTNNPTHTQAGNA